MKSTQILLSEHESINCVSSNVRDNPGSGFTKLCWMMQTLFFGWWDRTSNEIIFDYYNIMCVYVCWGLFFFVATYYKPHIAVG